MSLREFHGPAEFLRIHADFGRRLPLPSPGPGEICALFWAIRFERSAGMKARPAPCRTRPMTSSLISSHEFPEPADKPGNTLVKQFHSAVVILHSLRVGDEPFAVFLHESALPGFQLGCNRYCVPQFSHELGLFAYSASIRSMRSSMFISRTASKCILHQTEVLRKHYTKAS